MALRDEEPLSTMDSQFFATVFNAGVIDPVSWVSKIFVIFFLFGKIRSKTSTNLDDMVNLGRQG